LKVPVDLKNVAPELQSVDRTNLGHSLRLKLSLEFEQKTAAKFLQMYPSKSNLPPAIAINSPPGTGDRKRSEPLTNVSIENKSGQTTPSNKKKGQNLLGTIEEDTSERD
jgi:hypothetical protein